MKTIIKPWRKEELHYHDDKTAYKYLHIKKNHRLSKQYHKVKSETWRLIKGKALFELGEGAIVIIPNDVIHRITALTDTIIAETSTSELDDVERLEDDYNRSENNTIMEKIGGKE